MTEQTRLRNFETAVSRWAGMGPYYAMFPVEFAFDVVERYTQPNEAVLDPFAGRASSIYAAHALGRKGSGIEINPVGWLYGSIKMNPATQSRVQSRLCEIGRLSSQVSEYELDSESEFFRLCYSRDVLRFLLTARRSLDWRTRRVDGTLMAIILVYLHGKASSSLSNQMRQGKAMAPDYSVNWWKARKCKPPEIDPVNFLSQRIKWRYARGKPDFNAKSIMLGDSIKKLAYLHRNEEVRTSYKLLFTSPPYYSVTNYYYDQWLRLWMLGGADRPVYGRGQWQRRFDSKEGYRTLLEGVFSASRDLLTADAVIYVRTDARAYTLQTTTDVLTKLFPEKHIEAMPRPNSALSQTALFGDKSPKPGEVDLILH